MDTTAYNREPQLYVTWGSSVLLDNVAVGTARDAKQIALATHDRPIPWRFFFAARILNCDQTTDTATVTVLWNVFPGTGRETISYLKTDAAVGEATTPSPAFCQMVFSGTPINLRTAYKWTDRAPSQPLDDVNPTTSVMLVDTLIAQQLQVDATVIYAAAGDGPLDIRLDAQLAPYTNLPREYYQGIRKHGS